MSVVPFENKKTVYLLIFTESRGRVDHTINLCILEMIRENLDNGVSRSVIVVGYRLYRVKVQGQKGTVLLRAFST